MDLMKFYPYNFSLFLEYKIVGASAIGNHSCSCSSNKTNVNTSQSENKLSVSSGSNDSYFMQWAPVNYPSLFPSRVCGGMPPKLPW